MADRTKKMFADKIQEIAKYKAIKDIQIKELCEACEVERSTFYYHFCDKYELVAWIFQQYYLEEKNRATVINDETMIYNMFVRIQRQKDFFINALQDHSQNNLREYMLDFYISYERQILCRYLHTDTLDDEIEYEIAQYSYGCMEHTINWLIGKNKFTINQLAHYQYVFMPSILKEAFSNYHPK